MAKFLGYLFRGLGELLSNVIINIVYALVCAAEVVACLWVGYTWILAPMAAAPGSRDSPALLVIGPIILGLSLVPAMVLVSGTRKLFQGFFPNWHPIIFGEV